MCENSLAPSPRMGKSYTMIIYTDGSCHGNPGKGGWAFYCPETGLENWGSDERTTNNRMELTAIIHAMQVPGVTKIITDSDYCFKGCTKWIKGWVRKGWKTASGSDVKNDGLWKKILDLDPDRIEFEWVKAHDLNEHNNYVDQLANNAIKSVPIKAQNTDIMSKEYLLKLAEQLEERRQKVLKQIEELENLEK